MTERSSSPADNQRTATIVHEVPEQQLVLRPGARMVGSGGGGARSRLLAWSRAYLAVGEPKAASVCLHGALAVVSPPGELGRDLVYVQRVAEEVAAAYLSRNCVDEAAELLRATAAWGRAMLGSGPGSRVEQTVVAMNPLMVGAPGSRGRATAEPHDDERSEHELDEITQVHARRPRWPHQRPPAAGRTSWDDGP